MMNIKMSRSSSSSSIPIRKSRDSRPNARPSGRERERSLDSSKAGNSTRKTIGFLRRSKSQIPLNYRSPFMETATRSSLRTPLNSVSRKSPLRVSAKKEKRPINDKRWQNDNMSKVRNFLLEHPGIDNGVLQQLKPLTINLFVDIMNLLFKEIDDRITINMANYKEVVVSQLKIFNYPDTVSISLMKTVNTNHAWPQILAIFSWLIDLILSIRRFSNNICVDSNIDVQTASMLNILGEYTFDRLKLWNNNEDEELSNVKLKEDLDELYEISTVDNLQLDVDELKKKLTDYSNTRAKQEQKIEVLEDKISTTRKEMSEYDKEEEELLIEYTHYQQKYNEMLSIQEKKKLEVDRLKCIVKTQPYSMKDKKLLEEKVKDLRYTVSLKKEKMQSCQNSNQELDFKITDVKRNFEKHIVELNQEILKLSIIRPELDELLIRESGYNRLDFKEILEDIAKRNEEFKKKFEKEVEDNIKIINDLSRNMADVEKLLAKRTEEVFALKAIEKKKEKELREANAKLELEIEGLISDKNKIIAMVEEIKKSRPCISTYKEELRKKIDEKKYLENAYKMNEAKAIEFFEKLTKQILQNKDKMIAIRQRITGAVLEAAQELKECYKKLNENMLKMSGENRD